MTAKSSYMNDKNGQWEKKNIFTFGFLEVLGSLPVILYSP
jgi:hypothetical protein